MKFLKIDQNNISTLRNFIHSIGSSEKKFRYYSNRTPETAIENHIVTFLLIDTAAIGYGHLDLDHASDKVWLGICVKEGHYGKGYGKKIMKKLIDSYSGEIYLSVDRDNERAIHVYETFEFSKFKETEDTIFMRRENDSGI